MEKPRTAHIERNTKETQIDLTLNLDGQANYEIMTGVPFFNHMLDLLAKHALFDLNIKASGDVEIDYHHLVEDVEIGVHEIDRRDAGGDGDGSDQSADVASGKGLGSPSPSPSPMSATSMKWCAASAKLS